MCVCVVCECVYLYMCVYAHVVMYVVWACLACMFKSHLFHVCVDKCSPFLPPLKAHMCSVHLLASAK